MPSNSSGFTPPSATLATVYKTDQVIVSRSGVLYLATVAAVLAATVPPGTGGQFKFSAPANSNLLAGAM